MNIPFFKKSSRAYRDIAPDEIFLDSSNLPGLDIHQFEGWMERPIASRTLHAMFAACVLIMAAFGVRLYDLQITDGSTLYAASENNRLDKTVLFARRGTIHDRTGLTLAANAVEDDPTVFPLRAYVPMRGLAHVLGYVSYPKKDANGYYFQHDIVGKEGVEHYYNTLLSGENGAQIVETDALGEIISKSAIVPAVDGVELNLSIDARIQEKTYEFMEALANDVGFEGGGSVIMDVHTGEILSLVSFPEYSPQVMTDGEDADAIRAVLEDSKKPFLNRVTSGLYAPGSIIKPFVAIGALDREVIDPEKTIYSSGRLVVPNPYDPDKPTIFNDWKAHGYVDLRDALAVSSNVYFFSVGGGFEDQRGIGVSGIEEYTTRFGIGARTGIDLPDEVLGVIPNPEWKENTFPSDPTWRVGDTYNTAIGQYGFQVTPLQMARAVSAIANNGLLVSPRLRVDTDATPVNRVRLDDWVLEIVREGMRQAVTEGTAKGLLTPYVSIAAKTGTAELGVVKDNVNSWIVGFFPYERPRYAFATVMERGPATNLIGSLFVMRQLFDWMSINTPEYFDAK